MQINILDKNVVTLIIQDIDSIQNQERKRNEWIAYQATQGMLKDYVSTRLQFLFPKNAKKMRVSDIAVSQKVVDKISCAYSESPLRTLPGETQEASQELQKIYKQGKFNTMYQEFDEIFNLHRHGLYWVDYDLEKQKFRTSALRPFEYDLVRDPNTGEVLCVVLNYPDQSITKRQIFGSFEASSSVSDGINQLITESQYDSGVESKVYALWTPTNHVVIVVRKKEIKSADGSTSINYAVTYVDIPGNPNLVNPLGMIPFVYKQRGSSIDYPTFNPLTEQTINFNVLYSDLLTAATMQGFGQAVFSYPEDAEIKELEIGYMSAIKLPQSLDPNAPKSEYKFENPGPDLEGQQKTYLTYLKQVLSQHGITSNQAISGDVESFASGLDRMIANADVNKIVQKNQQVYAELEDDVYQIVRRWEELLGVNLFRDIPELLVYYPRPTVQISESEVIKNVISLLDAGLITKEKALMKLNPNLSPDQAEMEAEELEDESEESTEPKVETESSDETSEEDETTDEVIVNGSRL